MHRAKLLKMGIQPGSKDADKFLRRRVRVGMYSSFEKTAEQKLSTEEGYVEPQKTEGQLRLELVRGDGVEREFFLFFVFDRLHRKWQLNANMTRILAEW